MKILGLIGSPRKGSNTDLVVSEILRGATENYQETEKVYLYEIDIRPCVDCRVCKRGGHQCALEDDMQMLYPQLESADVLVFGTPLYWYGPSAKMKLLVDRLRPFIASEKLNGKRAVLVVPSEEGAKACSICVKMFEQSFKYLGIVLAGKLLPKAYERAEVKTQLVTLEAAFKLGKELTR